MRILGLDHLVIRCRDIHAMERFYTEVLGCTVDKRNEPLGLLHLRAGASLIDLVSVDGQIGRGGGAAPGLEGRNMDHLCIRIEPFDHESLRARFLAHGIDIGPVYDNYGAEGNGPSVYIKDPEQNTIELKGPPAARRAMGDHERGS